jgi:hypothetical protein
MEATDAMNGQNTGRNHPAHPNGARPVLCGSRQALDAYYSGREVATDWDRAPDGTPVMRVRVIERRQQQMAPYEPDDMYSPSRQLPARRYVDYRPAPGTAEYVAARRPRFSTLHRTLFAVAIVLLALAAVIWALSTLFAAILSVLPYVLAVAVLLIVGPFVLSLIGPRGGGGGGGVGGGGINITQSIRIR